MASLFQSLSEDMEKVIQVVEEGTKIIMGTSSHMGDQSATYPSDSGDVYETDEDGFLEDGRDMGTPLMGMADSVLSDIMLNQNTGPQTMMENLQAFSSAITWEELFIKCLLAFHTLVVITAYATIKKGDMYLQMGLMVFLGVIIRCAEKLNQIGNNRWRDFATQNYFDKNGIFMGVMVCAPLLIVCLFMLLSMIREAKSLLADLTKLKKKARGTTKTKKKAEKQTKKD